MTLYRHNGETICLTPEEMREIWQQVEFEYLCEDIRAIAEETFDALPPEQAVHAIAHRADRILHNNDAWYEAYWASINAAVEEWREKQKETPNPDDQKSNEDGDGL